MIAFVTLMGILSAIVKKHMTIPITSLFGSYSFIRVRTLKFNHLGN